MIAPAYAQDDTPELHPVLGKRPPREVTNDDILNLSREEGAAWVHGAVSQMAQVLAITDKVSSRCVMDWYFEVGDAATTIPAIMQQVPDAPATATIMTLAKKVCPTL